MDTLATLLIIVVVWIVIAIAVAVALGRTSAAAEHDYQLGALGREARSADAGDHAAPLSEPAFDHAAVADETMATPKKPRRI
ncbi:hypothetical protein [Microbacterium sp. SS28]|uniref:hypothetical protein n=1 Tax=Microbacterium sp. SS28 TaxID=2919948 RepID=UPI001FAB2C77|nr:hypothetical protein [Microbacterium sp. SS28]